MPPSSPEQIRDDLVRLVHRGASIRDFSLGAARILSRSVPFEGVCVLTMDPGTLPTGEVVENGLPPEDFVRMAEIEQGGEDVNAFRALAHSSCGAASLSAATHGKLDRSRRHREVRRPNGFGDELRAVLRSDSRTWGALTLLRGLAVLAPDNSLVSADPAAERWLVELRETGAGGSLPPVITAVATQARGIVAGQAEPASLARARIRLRSARWLLVRASTLGDEPDAQLAVILEPAPAEEMAPLIADAYDLSERERAVTRLVARLPRRPDRPPLLRRRRAPPHRPRLMATTWAE